VALNFERSPVDVEPNERQDDADEVTGLVDPSSDEILSWKLDGIHSRRCLPFEVALFSALVMGKVTTQQPNAGTDPNVYRHWLERDLTSPALKSVTLIEKDGTNQNQYTGIYGKSIKIIGERNAFIKLEAEFGGDGKRSTSNAAKPSGVSESYLRFGDVEFTRGGSLSGTVAAGTLSVSGGTSFKADLRSFEASISNNAVPVYEMGDNSGYVTRVERGDRYDYGLSAVLEMQDQGHQSGLENGTVYVLNIPLIGGTIAGGSGTYKYTVDLIFPKVVYLAGKKDRDGDSMIVNAEFKVLEDTTFGSAIVKVINTQSAYLN